MNHERIFKYIGFAAIALLLFGLLGWYVFIQRQSASIESADEARGFSIGIPSFLGSRGSTAANTESAGDSVESPAAQAPAPGGSDRTSAFVRFLGIGSSGEGARSNAGAGVQSAPTPTEQVAPRFWRVSANPVAGLAFTASTSSTLRYIERATGYVFDVDPKTGKARRVTNTLVPKVYVAHLGSGNLVALRTIDNEGNPVTLAGKIGTTTQEGLAALDLTNLGTPLTGVATLASSADMVMLAPKGAGSSLVRARFDGSNARELLSIPAGDFRIHFVSDSRIVLSEKAGSGIPGSAFEVSSSLTPLLTDIPGLLVLPNSSGAILYSSDTGSSVALFSKSGGSAAVAVSLQTVADKCVWAPGGSDVAYCAVPAGLLGTQFLDKWYRGEKHTEDIWYTVSASGTAEKLFTIDSARALDVESPIIDRKGEYLAFLNARDKSLWILRIEE